MGGLPQIAHSHSTLSSPLDGVPPSKKYARARSDSAPLHHHSQSQPYGSNGGYSTQNTANNGYWDVGRPRSGAGMRAGMVGGNGMMGGGMQGGMVNISGQGA